MDFITITHVAEVKAEAARRFGVGRPERRGPASSLAVLLRVRAAERARAGGSDLHRVG